jgi:hypothetical protein
MRLHYARPNKIREDSMSTGGIDAAQPVGASVLQTGVTMASPQTVRANVTKVIVAVHGVGDQYQYATIQTVVNQFCRFYKAPPATPLGSFHNGQPSYAFSPPYPADELEHFAFAEVYWAKIPRIVVSDQHTLENAQGWARTIVERMSLRWRQRTNAGESLRHIDFPLVKRVLGEMIETLTVLERVCFIAERGGLFKFDMAKLVDDYLGDVQVVADFASSRGEILDAFEAAMVGVDQQYPNAEIHIIAHSEGTVVALLGLLKGFRQATPAAWTDRIRGVMTIGSPIDKHLGLWPELFEGGAIQAPSQPIRWINYYDRGDPIGFQLDDFRDYIANSDLDKLFDFPEQLDIGFSRYPFPGKAHVDYWNDDAIFAHFISTVVTPAVAAAPPGPAARPATSPVTRQVQARSAPSAAPAPTDKPFNSAFCYGFPYVTVCILLFMAAYLPITAVADFAGWKLRALALVGDAVAVACALFAATMAIRVPRLTRRRGWYALICVAFVALVAAGAAVLQVRSSGWVSYPERIVALGLLTAIVIVGSLILDGLVRFLSAVDHNLGAKPMLAIGTIVLLGTMAALIEGGWPPGDKADHKLWPIALSTAAFVYLWWLATLVFDLAFVWHVYIRHAQAIVPLRRHRGQSVATSATGASAALPTSA